MSVKNYNEFINKMAKFVDTTTELADDEYRGCNSSLKI